MREMKIEAYVRIAIKEENSKRWYDKCRELSNEDLNIIELVTDYCKWYNRTTDPRESAIKTLGQGNIDLYGIHFMNIFIRLALPIAVNVYIKDHIKECRCGADLIKNFIHYKESLLGYYVLNEFIKYGKLNFIEHNGNYKFIYISPDYESHVINDDTYIVELDNDYLFLKPGHFKQLFAEIDWEV